MNSGESPILQFDKDRQKWLVKLNRGDWQGQTFHANPTSCPDPICQCSQVTLACSPAEVDDPGEDEKVSVVLDFVDRVLVECSGGGKIDPARLAGEIEVEATEEDWLLLEALFIDAKRKGMKEFDPASAVVPLSPDLLRDISQLAAYAEFFPYEELIEFSHGGSEWMVDDQYCVNPNCGCNDGVLLFIPVDTDIDEQVDLKYTLYPAVYFDVRQGKATSVATEGSGSVSAIQLADAFLEQCPDGVERLRDRRTILRTLVKHNLPERSEPFKRQEKVGRNAPCPCGSGKKYKRCCGG